MLEKGGVPIGGTGRLGAAEEPRRRYSAEKVQDLGGASWTGRIAEVFR